MRALMLLLTVSGCVGLPPPPPLQGDGSTGSSDGGGTGTTTLAGPETTVGLDSSSGGTGTSSEGSSSGMVDSTGAPPRVCLGMIEDGLPVDAACSANADCASGVCTIYTDVPLNDDAHCADTPRDCGTRVTGTIFDFTTGQPLAGADLVVAAALQAATNPTMATALVEAVSEADGRVDGTSAAPIMAPIGIVGLTSAAGYYLTATGIASPVDGGSEYEVGTAIHDIWAVPDSDLADWSDALSSDPLIPPDNLPLGEAGGVVGLVRDSTGLPLGGAVVSSVNEGSGALVRYLNDDGTFGETGTSDLGIFVILDPALAEEFEVDVGGMVVGNGIAGSANGAIFTLTFTVA